MEIGGSIVWVESGIVFGAYLMVTVCLFKVMFLEVISHSGVRLVRLQGMSWMVIESPTVSS